MCCAVPCQSGDTRDQTQTVSRRPGFSIPPGSRADDDRRRRAGGVAGAFYLLRQYALDGLNRASDALRLNGEELRAHTAASNDLAQQRNHAGLVDKARAIDKILGRYQVSKT